MNNITFECTNPKCKTKDTNPDWNGCRKCKSNEFQTVFLE